MRTIAQLKKDPRVADAFSEGEDGFWAHLKPGWCEADGSTHSVHEWTIRDLLREFRSIRKCECLGCRVAALPDAPS